MNEENGGNETAGEEQVKVEAVQGAAGSPAAIDERIEPLERENEQLRQMLRIRDAREVVVDELRRVGARSPGLLFGCTVNDLQFDEKGCVVNAAAIVEMLRREFPEQFGSDKPASIDARAGGGSQTTHLTKETLAKMKPAEIAKLDWAEVREVLANG